VPSTVELIVKVTNAVNPLRQVEKRARKAAEAIKKSETAFNAVSKASLRAKQQIEATQGGYVKASKVFGTFSAKVLNTEKAMRAQIRALREVQRTAKFNGAVYKRAGDEIARYEAILRSANTTTQKAKQANSGFAAGLRNLAIGFGAARAAQATLQAGIRRDESERRLRLLTQRFGETAQAQEAAQRAADKFNLSQTEANVQLSRLIARLRPMGLSMETIETAFAGFNTATILAGATASESAGAFLQLSQALGSGVLRGQELNSILEQAPLIAQAIALEMGVTVGALKKLGEEGEITSEIVIAALGRVERDGADQLTEALKGPAASIKDFQNAVEDVQVALTQDIIPEMADSFRELAGIIEDLGPLFRFVGAGVGGALSLAREGISALTLEELRDPKGFAEKRIREGKMPSPFAARALFEGTGPEGRGLAGMQDLAKLVGEVGGRDKNEVLMELMQKRLGMFALPGRTKRDAKPPRPKPLTEQQQKGIATAGNIFQQQTRALEILKEESELGKKLLQSDHRRADVIAQINGLEGIGAERRQEIIDITNRAFDAQKGSIIGQAIGKDVVAVRELAEAQNQALLPLEREAELITAKLAGNEQEILQKHMVADIMSKVKGLNEDDVKAQVAKLFALREQQTEAERLQQIYDQIGQTISTGIVDALMDAKSASEALSGVLNNVARQMMTLGINTLLKSTGLGIFSNLSGFFHAGGRPPVGRPAVVGEKGPEIFVPDRAGTILPNGVGMGGGGSTTITVNVDASETSADASSGEAAQLGKAIGLAVQQELVKQKRPGGLLAGV
jgi:tape measure domain-containing protein